MKIKIILLSVFLLFSFSNFASIRDTLLTNLESQLTVRETSYNRGVMVDIYNKSVGVALGSPWCGSFVGYNLTKIGVKNPNSGRAADYAKSKDIIWRSNKKTDIKLLTGDVVTFYYSSLGRVGHTGFYIKKDKEGYFITIEGNTNGLGSREGGGVYKKKRDPDKIYAISRYINDSVKITKESN